MITSEIFTTLIEPDLFHWEQLQQTIENANITLNTESVQQLRNLSLGSNYATAQLAKYPELISTVLESKSYAPEEDKLTSSLHDLSDINDIKKQLRLFRHRKLVEIIFLDICHSETLENTLINISELAEIIIQQALLKAEQIISLKHGQPIDSLGNPMLLNIIAMGKLGGKELNFSSDIDLICCYSEEGQLKGKGNLSYTQYFAHVVKLFSQLLNDSTADGFVYRVDLRLRPWGDSGPVVFSHSAFEHYYQLHGREWEQYAMVKARVITGSNEDKKHLQSILKPFVYRRYHDYRVFDGLAQLKKKIDQQAKTKGGNFNVKTGQGGIREIEFYVQAFQILKGGRNLHLQTQSLFKAIQVLSEQDLTEQQDLSQVRASYCFFRMLENRIQMMNDQQTHEIPQKQNLLDRISLGLDYQHWNELEAEMLAHQSAVSNIFSTLFTTDEESESNSSSSVILDELSEEEHFTQISNLGFRESGFVHQTLQDFYQSKALMFMSEKAKGRFRCFFPLLLAEVAQHNNQRALLDRMLAFLSTIAGRSVYFEMLHQNNPLLAKLVNLFNDSQWIADEVTKHPILLESLLYPGALSGRFDQHVLEHSLNIQLKNVKNDVELELDVLRQFKRAQTIVIASAEIATEISTDEVSLYLSELAEIILSAVHKLSVKELAHQYGYPEAILDSNKFTPSLGIIGYGKLGGNELHYQSDLDIIFIHNSAGDQQQTNGKKCIDNAIYFARLGQKIISKITLLTAAGKLYEIDTRLRPDGASGMLVPSTQSYLKYQLEKAWVWEHQSIVRARFISGDSSLAADFKSTREQVLNLTRDEKELPRAIVEMRDKIYQTKTPREGDLVNLKHSRGCLVDIEFLVQYWVLKYANKFATLTETTDNIGLITELHQLQLITDKELQLRDIYQSLHTLLHAKVLQNEAPEIESDQIETAISLVKACWKNNFKNLEN